VDEQRIDAVIHAAYEAALEPEGWGELLGRLAALFGCHFADLFARRGDFVEFAGLAHGLDRADYEDEFLGTWVKRNVWGSRHPPRFSGEIVTTRTMVEKSELVRTEMYNEYLAPRGLHEGLRLALSVADGWVQDISLLRSWAAGPFEGRELAIAEALLPHLRRAVAVADRLREAARARDAGLAALEAVRHACLVLDGAGRPVFTNEAAVRLFARPGALLLGPHGVSSPDAATARALATLLARAPTGAGHLRVPQGEGRPALLLLAIPAGGGREAFALRRPATILLISQPDTDPGGTRDQLAAIFGLTGAEAALAADLLAGSSVGEIAERRGRSVNTIRTHLARLMAKTGTQRQGALMRELMGAAQLRVPAVLEGVRRQARGVVP
jgi:DNA-binding CsgD family transcriptional regulator/PAS domain-containing protein